MKIILNLWFSFLLSRYSFSYLNSISVPQTLFPFHLLSKVQNIMTNQSHPAGTVQSISSAACIVPAGIGELMQRCWKLSAFFD